MLTSLILIAVAVVSLVTYWWLGRRWPEAKELQDEIRAHRKQARALLYPKTYGSRTEPPERRPWT